MEQWIIAETSPHFISEQWRFIFFSFQPKALKMAKDVKAVATQEQAASDEKAEAKAQHASLFEISLILKPYFWPRSVKSCSVP